MLAPVSLVGGVAVAAVDAIRVVAMGDRDVPAAPAVLVVVRFVNSVVVHGNSSWRGVRSGFLVHFH